MLQLEILAEFGTAWGLSVNLAKYAMYPIRCERIDIQDIMEPFPCQVQSFPCQYLGLPLSTKALTCNEVMPMIPKMSRKLPAWKGKLLNKAGRLRFINMVLSSILTYHVIVFALKKWAIKKMDKLRRNFFWKGRKTSMEGTLWLSWEDQKFFFLEYA